MKDYIEERAVELANYIIENNAVEQAVRLMTSIERYEYGIYDNDYGIETNDLIGRSMDYVETVIESRIKDACSIDERVLDMRYFSTRVEKERLFVSFTVVTVFGTTELEIPFDGIVMA